MPLLLPLYTLILFTLSLTFFANSADSAALAKKLTTITDAIPEQRFAPKYPRTEVKSGREGYVVMSFIVEPDGSTSNVLVEDSSGSKYFEKASKKALQKWTFKPAIENGEPIQQCKNTVQLDFKMSGDNESISRKFYSLYNRFNKALGLDAIDSQELDTLFNKINELKLQKGSEFYYKHLIISQYYKREGNQQKQLYYLNRALNFSDSYSYLKKLQASVSLSAKEKQRKEEQFFPLYHQKLQLELNLEKISDALKTSNNLLLFSNNSENHPAYQKIKIQLESLIRSDKPLLVAGTIAEREFWQHKLLRHQFSFIDIQGDLTKIDLRCRNKRHVYTVNNRSTWNIPQSWQDCSVYVYGEDNASFTLVQSNDTSSESI
jgi:TonB family protein